MTASSSSSTSLSSDAATGAPQRGYLLWLADAGTRVRLDVATVQKFIPQNIAHLHLVTLEGEDNEDFFGSG